MIHLDVKKDYPLSEKREDLIYTPTGRRLKEINMKNVLNGNVKVDDCRISAQTLEYQAQIAESANNSQIAENLRRAAELTYISDDRVLEIYEALRPFRSSKEELLEMADELEEQGAVLNARYIREAADVYEARGKLSDDK